jgi:hypothetical protein
MAAHIVTYQKKYGSWPDALNRSATNSVVPPRIAVVSA